ncbi:tetratricopeptide repeat protein [Modicisalibacter luteus]|uniref:Tetratricopeptide repeat protein n=1 Tax=Modicisalibacter luteus TaxID=453962 RepID=A0ABV7LZH5_9GAMM|nr:tetratricopeptide repeat protein [Halomonas lutea]GHA95692.1 hypothetical protein GCM10007159_16440 [Halomonas lutea]
MSVNVTLRWSKRHVKVHQCLLAATSAMLLGGCATERGHSLALDTGSIDPAYQDWFDGGAPADMDSMDWGRIDFARQAAEAGNAQRAEGLLESLMNEGFPPAYYEMGKLYEEGLGVAPDPARAADYYGQALRRPSPILGNASLRLGRLYRDGRGVERDDNLAYQLFRQAVSEDTGPNANVALAEMLVEGRGTARDTQRASALYSQAAARGNAQALQALAKAYARGGWLERDPALASDYAERYAQTLKARARQGDTDAMAALARLYDRDGLLGPQSEQHRHWLMRAAHAGHTGSMGKAGQILLKEGSTEQGLAMLRQSAQAGDVYAMEDLGEALIERAPKRARQWLSTAADRGSANAAATLGRAYLHGSGLGVDKARAAHWLAQASRGGHAGAAAELGRMYLSGDGVEQDPAKGAEYLQAAAERGHNGARADLGELLLTGKGIPADPDRAAALLKTAARSGHTGAARVLGNAYLEGTGLAHDPQQAEQWLTQAAESGHVPSRYRLGYAYLLGENGFTRDVQRGEQLLLSAAKQGHSGAQVALGREYLKGDLLAQNRQQGTELLYQAAQQGHPSARLTLAKAYLWANGLENANQQQALLWLDTVLDDDSQFALETMRQLLTKADDEALANAML